MFTGTESQKPSFLEQTKAARAERAYEKQRESAIVVIQAQCRGWAARRLVNQRIMWISQKSEKKTLKLTFFISVPTWMIY